MKKSCIVSVALVFCIMSSSIEAIASVTAYMLEGEYTLLGFTIDYDYGLTITEDDVNSFSGSMTITAITANTANLAQTINAEGLSGYRNQNVTLIDDHTLQTKYNYCTYNLIYTFSDNYLATTADHVCELSYKETDFWQKISGGGSSC